ncbi:MAG TPA: serine/threonine-protein kinase [Thermoanaerobaculaceae bacterium]|nr:serine/threonine-protein kinase [Thermoanaerobaculaceae bacterium]HRS16040.1 serine/threonine-protein kinase [Thermoanaerobaculaceae bacterium]
MAQEVTSFGTYTVERFVEQSSVGVSYIGRAPDSGEKLLVKVPTPPEEAQEARVFTQALLERAAAARALRHPSLVAVRDAGTYGEAGFPFVVYELVEGVPLAESWRAGRSFSQAEVVDLGIALASVLVLVHEHGQLHGSISPQTILVTPRGTCRLADLALTQPDRSPFDRRGQFRGEASYMAPEQVAGGSLDGRADLFSLGVVLYELLIGELPYAWRSKDVPGDTTQGEAPVPRQRRADLSPALNAILYRMIQKDPARRPARASEVLEALQAIKHALERQPAAAPATRKNGLPLWALAAAAGIVVVGLAAFAFWRLGAPAPSPQAQAAQPAEQPAERARTVELRREAEAALAAGDLVKARRLTSDLWAAGSSDRASLELAERIKAACEAAGKTLIERGHAALARRQWEEASASFAKALAVLPDDSEALRGAELARKGWMEHESRQAQARVQQPPPAPAASPTALPAALRLEFQSPLTRGRIEVSIDGKAVDPVVFDFEREGFMGMRRTGGGRVAHGWNLPNGRHTVRFRLLDAAGRPLQTAAYEIDVGPDTRYLVRLEMKDASALPRFYLSRQR